MIKDNNKIRNYGIWLTAITVFLSMPPVFVWDYSWIHTVLLLMTVSCGLTLKRNNISKSGIFFIILLFIYTILVLRAGYPIFRLPVQLLLCFYVLFDSDYINKSFNRYITIYSLFLIPSIFSYICFMSGIISLPELGRVEPLASTNTTDFFHYPFLLISSSFQDGGFARFRAFFDEPGVVGTVSAIAIILLKYDYKDWRLYPNIIGGFLSFSLAFFVIFALGSLLFSKKKGKLLVVLITSVIVIYILNKIYPEVVDMLLLDRIQIDNGKLAGDDRTSLKFETWYENFKYTEGWWLGCGNNYSQIINYGGASYKDLIVNYGIIFFLFYITSFLVYAHNLIRNKTLYLSYLLIFIVILYQRPFIEMNFYFCLLYFPICALSERVKSKELQ